jgi:hypothetical protein
MHSASVGSVPYYIPYYILVLATTRSVVVSGYYDYL